MLAPLLLALRLGLGLRLGERLGVGLRLELGRRLLLRLMAGLWDGDRLRPAFDWSPWGHPLCVRLMVLYATDTLAPAPTGVACELLKEPAI